MSRMSRRPRHVQRRMDCVGDDDRGWLEHLAPFDLPVSALIAFRWAQFPPEQTYQPGGDWNQGMLRVGRPLGTRFDLIARWDADGRPAEGVLRNVSCADSGDVPMP
jgi:hypothetical protein